MTWAPVLGPAARTDPGGVPGGVPRTQETVRPSRVDVPYLVVTVTDPETARADTVTTIRSAVSEMIVACRPPATTLLAAASPVPVSVRVPCGATVVGANVERVGATSTALAVDTVP